MNCLYHWEWKKQWLWFWKASPWITVWWRVVFFQGFIWAVISTASSMWIFVSGTLTFIPNKIICQWILKQWVSGVRIPLNHLQSLQPVVMEVSVRVAAGDSSLVRWHCVQFSIPYSRRHPHCQQAHSPAHGHVCRSRLYGYLAPLIHILWLRPGEAQPTSRATGFCGCRKPEQLPVCRHWKTVKNVVEATSLGFTTRWSINQSRDICRLV